MRGAVILLLLASSANIVLACACAPPPVRAGQAKPLNSAICNHLPRPGDDSADSAIFHGGVRGAYVDARNAFLLELPRGTLTEAEAARIRGTESPVALENPLAEMDWGVPRRVELDVIEPFSGPAGKRFVLNSGLGGGDCVVDFKPVQEYLVFAYRAAQSGRWVAGICGGTQHIRFAAEDVKTLAALKRGQTLPPRVYGWVAGVTLDKQGHSECMLAGARLRLYSNVYERRTVSHSGGRFRFDLVPPGRSELPPRSRTPQC